MRLKEGDSVRVKAGTKCPEMPDMEIAGWQGRAVGFGDEDGTGKPLVAVAWDSVTLRAMPTTFIEQSERKGLEWAEMTLYADEVEPARPRDSGDDVDEALDELETRYSWLGMGAQGKRIYQVVSAAASMDDLDVLTAWENHLREALAFPFEAKLESEGKGSETVTVAGIEYPDDEFGLMTACQAGGKQRLCALADLLPTDPKSPNRQPLLDYRAWLANA